MLATVNGVWKGYLIKGRLDNGTKFHEATKKANSGVLHHVRFGEWSLVSEVKKTGGNITVL